MKGCRGKPIKEGEIYGHLKILKIDKDQNCLCVCTCSNKVTYPLSEIASGRKKTCGCRTRSNILLEKGMIIRGVKLIERVEDEIYKGSTGRKKRWLVECIKCKKRRVIRESDLKAQRIAVCPACSND